MRSRAVPSGTVGGRIAETNTPRASNSWSTTLLSSAAQPPQPVLALVGGLDPWFRAPVLRGDCGAFIPADAPMRSVVYPPPNHLARKHWLSFDTAVQATVLEFLSAHLPAKKDVTHD